MTRKITIEGMSCSHCAARVEKALNAIPGVRATVDLAGKTATVVSDAAIDTEVLAKAVTDAGYTLTA